MTIRGEELLNAAELLAKEKEIVVAIKHSLLGGATAGISAFVGGLLLGPVGIAIGGGTGGLVGYVISKDKFKPLNEVIANLTISQQRKFVEHLTLALQDVDITDIAKVTAAIMTANSPIQALFLNAIVSFAENDLHMSVKQ